MTDADVIDLFDRPDFNGKLLARFGAPIRAFVRENRLYIVLAADPGCPAEWYGRVQCDVSDLPNRYLATARVDGWIEDPDESGSRLLYTQPLEPATAFEGDCSRMAVVTLHIGTTLRRLMQARCASALVTAP